MTRAEIDGMMLELHSRRENAKLNPKRLPQTDGADDDDSNDDDDDAGGDSDINSELDDDDSEDENVETDHIILCQYEKVTRIKNKWKCVLKDGIVNIQGKDYLFNRVKKR